MEANLTPIIKDSFLQFSGAVLQSRALADARDMLKPSARQIFYCLYTDKFVHEKPFQKTLKAIGSSFRTYIHGDSSAEGVIMRAGQPFAMRYPLMDIEGSYGTLLAPGSWSAPRYTSARLSELANYLFKDIEKDVITEWKDNYDNTEQYPMALPSKGFYNLVNGTYGIGVGAGASVPQYNLKEMNEALIKVLWNPDISFDEIFIAPDFATGAILLNIDEVKESHRTGRGKSCKLRSVIEWDKNERCLIVKEIPYMVYTETICKELENIINSEENPGFERFNDLTGVNPLIKIYLSKNYTPEKALKYLYKNTSLQSYYGINFTILEDGRYPKTVTWKELLQYHINHELIVYRRGFEFDLRKIKNRIHIIDGLMKAYDQIDEVVRTIKQSASTQSANIALQNLLSIDEAQAKAILDLKLSRLSKLDINKLKNELEDLEKEKKRIEDILSDEVLLKKEVEHGLKEVSEKFGDNRRTQILNLATSNDEVIEEKNIQISLTNKGFIYANEVSTLYRQSKNTLGQKFKLDNGEFIINSTIVKNTNQVMFFSQKGNMVMREAGIIPLEEKVYYSSLLNTNESDPIVFMSAAQSEYKYIIFVTKNGLIKKTELQEYNTNRTIPIKAITLDDNDLLVNVFLCNDENIAIATKNGQLLISKTTDVRSIGRIARGIKGIKLNPNDYVIRAQAIRPTDSLITISSTGVGRKLSVEELKIQGHNTKGIKILKEKELNESLADFLPIKNEKEVIIVTTRARAKLNINDIPLLSRAASGNKLIKLKSEEKIISLLKI